MKSAVPFSLLPLLATALPAASSHNVAADNNSTTNIQLYVYNPGFPNHQKPITACSGKFWIGGKSCTSCPIGDNCPPAQDGAVVLSFKPSTGRVGMNTVVPGGQQVYVGSGSALKFTQAHAGGIPRSDEGAILDGFTWREGKPWDGDRDGRFGWSGFRAGWWACPPSSDATNGAEAQLFAALPGRGCSELYVQAPVWGGDPTWQYD